MKPGLAIGHQAELKTLVSSGEIIRLSGNTSVFSTPSMINLMEHAARKVLEPFFESGEESVGINVYVDHLAATPLGHRVRAVAEVTSVDRTLIEFKVTAFDEQEEIGRGTHRRAIIKLEKFKPRLARKAVPDTPDASSTDVPRLERLSVTLESEWVHVVLNRPEKLNCFDSVMTREFGLLIQWLENRPDVRVVMLSGNGKSFCAGDDVKEASALSNDEILRLNTQRALNCIALTKLPQIIVAAIHGHCLGGGFMLAASCDFRIAARSAKLGLPEINLGWPPAYAIAQAFELLGRNRLLELALMGETIDAQRAFEWGMLNRIVPAMRLAGEAERFCRRLLEQAPDALREAKQRIHTLAGVGKESSHVDDLAAFYRCLQTVEARDRTEAFLKKGRSKSSGR